MEASFRGDADLMEDIKSLISGLRDSCSVVCVAAAGNSSDGSLILPAAWEGVVSVGSVASDGSVASTSTRNDYVDICANGADVLSTQNPSYSNGELYGVDSGTSFAAPQVAAVAALVKAQHPSWDADKVEAKLLGSAASARCLGFIDVDGDGKDDVGRYGRGLLDAAAAVGWRQSPSTYVDPFDEILRRHEL